MRAAAERAERRELGVIAIDDVRRGEPEVQREHRKADQAPAPDKDLARPAPQSAPSVP
jgi:hypothetical protein